MPHENSYHIEAAGGGAVTLVLTGRMDLERFGELAGLIGAVFDTHNPSKLNVDMGGVTYLDSAGALFIVELEDEARRRSVVFELSGLSREKMGILSLIDTDAMTKPSLAPRERRMNIVEQLGAASLAAVRDVYDIISFSGELICELGYSLMHLQKVRWGDVVSYMKKVGVDGLPIVGLISFLLGLIMAFMSSLQLKQFGANIYVASLVAVAMVR